MTIMFSEKFFMKTKVLTFVILQLLSLVKYFITWETTATHSLMHLELVNYLMLTQDLNMLTQLLVITFFAYTCK